MRRLLAVFLPIALLLAARGGFVRLAGKGWRRLKLGNDEAQQARLIAVGLPVLVLPWWPSEVEESGWAPNYAETERPGRTARC